MLQSALVPATESKMRCAPTNQSKGLPRDPPNIHRMAKLHEMENGRSMTFGVTCLTFQVLVYFNFKVLGIVGTERFGLIIIQLQWRSKRAC